MLEVEDIYTSYGENSVLRGVSFEVMEAECVAILGRNGAGKTTTLRTIFGLARCNRGRVRLKGADITRTPTWRVVRAGMSLVPDDRGIFASVTVDEHLMIAMHASRGRPKRLSPALIYEMFPRLAARRHSLGGALSGGEQQMLSIGRAMLAGPDLLVLDEPSEGLAPVIVEMLENVLRQAKDSGMSILLVEQNYRLATALADRVYVLGTGRVQFGGTVAQLDRADQIRNTYLSI
ncbi:ABC transporter ATP-binding protein [Caenimonas soli]|uniref:ABC transporter ATP-binding protein n=1 Tax=Caenimonas soli TaxID=2735555 RepID=UPI0015525D58|nr:ABC transporter ATP-binding protein [Caenimonas soli]NPC59144.1 ABC transporter ATP-binding protein [Caenimonas soli]